MSEDQEELIENDRDIFGVGNFYGGLVVGTCGDKFYWGIENYNGTRFVEIPKYLYDALCKHDDEQRKPDKKTANP
jgi:hypothetical protein